MKYPENPSAGVSVATNVPIVFTLAPEVLVQVMARVPDTEVFGVFSQFHITGLPSGQWQFASTFDPMMSPEERSAFYADVSEEEHERVLLAAQSWGYLAGAVGEQTPQRLLDLPAGEWGDIDLTLEHWRKVGAEAAADGKIAVTAYPQMSGLAPVSPHDALRRAALLYTVTLLV